MSLDAAALERAVERHGRVARVLVAAAAGSAPREAGASMLVHAEGQEGTIGGGALEWEAAARARACLAGSRAAPRIDRLPLGPALGQCCGGSVVLATEIWDADALSRLDRDRGVFLRAASTDAGEVPLRLRSLAARARDRGAQIALTLEGGWLAEPLVTPQEALWVWGAGHVGRAIATVCAPLPGLDVTLVDTAPERLPDPMPEGVTPLVAARPVAVVGRAPDAAHHLVLTYSHTLDLDLCHALLSRPFGSLGLIGSATKWARFSKRLRALGHPPERIARIRCPIGERGLGKHPQAIAIGVARELMLRPRAALRDSPTGGDREEAS
ncbi:MAG: xanthine dehydrogenase accessory protein XdhC [Rhodobacteraceae bacterium]|nr:xanthine dehydrogenase accessory protein XdhC [Paracoccaceae bacterium]